VILEFDLLGFPDRQITGCFNTASYVRSLLCGFWPV